MERCNEADSKDNKEPKDYLTHEIQRHRLIDTALRKGGLIDDSTSTEDVIQYALHLEEMRKQILENNVEIQFPSVKDKEGPEVAKEVWKQMEAHRRIIAEHETVDVLEEVQLSGMSVEE